MCTYSIVKQEVEENVCSTVSLHYNLLALLRNAIYLVRAFICRM